MLPIWSTPRTWPCSARPSVTCRACSPRARVLSADETR
jgi:hypothetical protein